MNEFNDGGPAFPSQPLNPRGEPACAAIEGMSLRDYVAVKAMQEFLKRTVHVSDQEYDDTIAEWSYQTADAMLRARGPK